MLSPLNRIPLTGVADATGAAAISNQLQGPNAAWGLIYVAIQASVGSPNWAILLAATKAATGAPLVYGTGAQAMLGPFLLGPGERATIVATGAGAGAQILGQALGWQADDPSELISSTPITTALATPLTPVPISGAVTILGTIIAAIGRGSLVSLLGGISGQVQGDVAAAALAADSATETITSAGAPILSASAVLASFKAAGTIAPVGNLGPVAQGTPTQVNPTFGQATSAGDLLVAWVTASTAEPTTAAAGWAKIKSFTQDSPWAAVWARPNCGANEAAPVFTAAGGSTPMHAQLGEFSGAVLVSPTDQTGQAGTNSASSLNPVAGGLDVAFGDLVLLCSRWALTSAATASFAETFNNGAAAIHAGDTGGTSQLRQSSFAYAIIPPAATSQPLGTAPWAYDSSGSSHPGLGVAPSVVLAATPGKTYTLRLLDAVLETTTAAADSQALQILDGAGVIYQSNLSTVGGIDANDKTGRDTLAYKGTAGNSMTVKLAGMGANSVGTINIGAYLR